MKQAQNKLVCTLHNLMKASPQFLSEARGQFVKQKL